ncbi:MAG: 23S rRNA (adenine(2503)-C(2))-methyltransferase RlmN [Candidatus Omnitrophota bacterium]
MKRDIKELTLEELKKFLVSWNEPAFRAKQVFSWIYRKGAVSFDGMSNLPAELKQRLNENFAVFSLEPEAARESTDGTKKFLFKLEDKKFIEAVSIPSEKRLTGCISSQAGCKFACVFCASGALGFKRNLSCAEILSQVLYLKNNSLQPLTHIVFMGTGEPLDNYDNVLKAVRIINSDYAFNIGARRITISTCGIIPGIKKLAEEGLQIELSVSLHSADNCVRDKLMPVNKKYPLKDLIPTLCQYAEATNRQVTFEYMLAKGVNSDLQSALKLCKIIRGLNCKVNLISVNSQRELGFLPPDRECILFFRDALIKAGIPVTVRRPRGQDIEAACGQLRLRYEKE